MYSLQQRLTLYSIALVYVPDIPEVLQIELYKNDLEYQKVQVLSPGQYVRSLTIKPQRLMLDTISDVHRVRAALARFSGYM